MKKKFSLTLRKERGNYSRIGLAEDCVAKFSEKSHEVPYWTSFTIIHDEVRSWYPSGYWALGYSGYGHANLEDILILSFCSRGPVPRQLLSIHFPFDDKWR